MIAATATSFSSIVRNYECVTPQKYKAINIFLNKNEILFLSSACTTYPLTYKFIKKMVFDIFSSMWMAIKIS